ncbi:MAG: RHS repeat domain-containing protein [Bacteroidota bacterium]
MKTKFLLLTLFAITRVAAQQENLYQQEVNKLVSIPNSPEAQAFAKYGDIDVSLYSGTPNIVVPLHTFKGREMDLPMTLTYDASGIKVEQLATWVGLGWNLNVGGRISRVANGLPDDYIAGNYLTLNDASVVNDLNSYLTNTSKQFPTEQAVRDYYQFLFDINRNFIDTQSDIYKVAAPGLNTTIVFDPNDGNLPKSLDNPRIKINGVQRGSAGNGQIIGWSITNEAGTTYFFGDALSITGDEDHFELTKRNGNDDANNGVTNNEYVSSWLLTRIQSANGKDVYDFDYFNSGYWTQELFASSALRATVPVLPNDNYYTENEVAELFAGGAGYWISQQFLSSITHNTHLLATFNRANRFDVQSAGTTTRLSHINVYDYTSSLLKEFAFNNNTYFNDDDPDPLDRKLKLDGVQIKDATLAIIENYVFEYDRPNDLPPRTSKSQDFAGYYNGANNNVLFEQFEIGGKFFEGADRKPDSNSAKVGLLQKITYPTGGYTTFEFEGNLAEVDVNNEITVYDLQMSLYPNDPDNNNFYLDENNFPPDDKYSLDGVHPKIKRTRFTIEDRPSPLSPYDYTINIYGTAPNTVIDAYIFKIDSTFSGNDFADYLALGFEWYGPNKTANVDIDLDAGEYVGILVMDELPGTANGVNGPQYGNILFTITHKEDVFTSEEVDQGGLRISTIRNYESQGNFANGKQYSYLSQKDNYKPVLSEIKNYDGQSALVRSASFPRGDEPIVTYPRVREYQIDENGNSEGYVDFRFFPDNKGLTPRNSPPFESNYYPGLKGGEVRNRTAYNSQEEKVATKDVDYYETLNRPINIDGLAVFYDDANIGDYVYIQDFGTHFSPVLLSGNDCSGSGVASPTYGVNFCAPLACGSFPCNGYVGFMDATYGGLTFRETFVNGAFGGVAVQKDTLFFKDAVGNPLYHITSTTTTYEQNSGFYLPTEVETEDSTKGRYKQTFTYPSSSSGEYGGLFTKNNLVEVVAATTEKLDSTGTVTAFISARKNDYPASGNVILPTAILTSKTGETITDLEERITFSYYTNGNLREAKQVNAPATIYIWGYDDMYPVAKVENATYGQVTGTGVNLTVLNSLSSTTAAKQTELEKIRNGLPDAMVTTYTYDPAVGLTSLTDPRGYTTYYEYDAFTRLKAVRNAANQLVTEHNYHYKQQN